MPVFDLPDARIHYVSKPGLPRAGSTNAPVQRPLFLLHGFTGSSANWDDLTARLSWPSIALDLPGHGATETALTPDRLFMERVAADVAACIRAQAAGPVHLLGYSMGGRLALYLAVHHPDLVASLILESSSPGLDDDDARQQRRAADDLLAARIERDGIPAFVTRWESLPLFASQAALPETTRRRLRDQRLRNQAAGLAASLRGMGTGVQPPLWEELADLSIPVLLVTGELDEKFCAINAMMQQCIPSARHVIVESAGHTIHLEQPDQYVRHVADFLTRQER